VVIDENGLEIGNDDRPTQGPQRRIGHRPDLGESANNEIRPPNGGNQLGFCGETAQHQILNCSNSTVLD
jgi:hypothetical protein